MKLRRRISALSLILLLICLLATLAGCTLLAKTLPHAQPREGYTFVGWEKDGVLYQPGARVPSLDGYVAIYEPTVYTLTLVLGDGSEATFSGTLGEERTIASLLSGCSYTWVRLPDGTPYESAHYRFDHSATLYTDATVPVYTVSCELWEGQTQTYTYTPLSGLTVPTPVRDGYTFLGWVEGDALLPSLSLPAGTGGDRLLRAEWQLIVGHIRLIVDGDVRELVYSVESPVDIQPPQRPGFRFLGWDYDGGSTYLLTAPGNAVDGVTYTARYEACTYTLTFDARGGTDVSDLTCSYGTQIAAPPCERAGFTLLGWYRVTDDTPYDFSTPVTENVALYARWESQGPRRLFYLSDGPAVSADVLSGARLESGATVHLQAALYGTASVFDAWYVGDTVYSYDRCLTYTAEGAGDLTLTARYRAVRTFALDLTEAEDALLAYAGATQLSGEGIRASDYTVSAEGVRISRRYLDTLARGRYVFYLQTATSAETVFLDITADSATVRQLTLDVESAYPALRLCFEEVEGIEYLLSVDGGDLRLIRSGDALTLDRSVTHTLTVRALQASAGATVTYQPPSADHQTFYDASFEYGGQRHDYVAEDWQQLRDILAYLSLVALPTATPEGGTRRAEAQLCVMGDWFSDFQADPSRWISLALADVDASYLPSYTVRLSSADPHLVTVCFTSGSALNTRPSTTVAQPVEDVAGLLTATGESRTAFPIDSSPLVQTVRTLYELESLPFGVRPVFVGESVAREVYERACAVLSTYVSEGMSDRERLTVIYRYLALHVTYDTAAAALTEGAGDYRAFTAAGALLDGVAVCDGIASALRLMCLIEGIDCVEVTGVANGGPHAWNSVCIDGLWHAVDATWAQNGGYVWHRYLLMGETALRESGHVEHAALGADAYTLHVSLDRYGYYERTLLAQGVTTVVSDAAGLSQLLRLAGTAGTARIEFRYDGYQFAADLRRAQGWVPVSVRYTAIEGRYYWLSIG